MPMMDIRQLLYTLKQDYGYPLALYHRKPDVPNLETGSLTTVEHNHRIRKAVVLPVSIYLKFFKYAGDPQFQYGGDLSINRRAFIVDKHDLHEVSIKTPEEWYVIYNHKRYTIEIFNEYDFDKCYHIIGRELDGEEVDEQVCISIQDWVYPIDTVVLT